MGGGKQDTPGPSQAETMSAQIASRMFQQTDPLRLGFLTEYGKLFGLEPVYGAPSPKTGPGVGRLGMLSSAFNEAGGGISGLPNVTFKNTGAMYDPESSPLYKPMFLSAREGLATGNNAARDAILANTAPGGGQTSALANMEIGAAKDRAMVPATLSSSIIEDMIQKAYGMASGAPQTALSGLGISASSAAARQQIAAQQQSQSNSMKGNMGLSLGLMAATGGMGKAPAAAGAGAGTTAINPAGYSLGGPFTF